MVRSKLIENTIIFVKSKLANAEGGHDWSHIFRVWQNAKNIAKSEKVDQEIVEVAALLHDIADSKFHNGNEEIGPQTALEYLRNTEMSNDGINHIINIIRYMSFKNSFKESRFVSKEMEVVQDADRLDAIGAIGIARAFNFGGFKDRMIFDPEILPVLNMNKKEYKKSTAPTINHFYEKLLLLKDKMNTTTGKTMAKSRHDFMLLYLEQFYSEVEVQNWP
ncbi:MAG: HD domain-containing protein [Saprospiraceae bacterium]